MFGSCTSTDLWRVRPGVRGNQIGRRRSQESLDFTRKVIENHWELANQVGIAVWKAHFGSTVDDVSCGCRSKDGETRKLPCDPGGQR